MSSCANGKTSSQLCKYEFVEYNTKRRKLESLEDESDRTKGEKLTREYCNLRDSS